MRHLGPAIRVPLLASLVALVLALPAGARALLSVEEALALAFPGCSVERGTVFLNADQQKAVEDLAGSQSGSRIVHPYQAECEGEVAGTAYFDAHRVRTLSETLMVVVGPDGSVARTEILTFDEPPDYIPRAAWYAQFLGESLDEDLDLDRDIRPVTGATLTAVATTAAVRRVLAMHRILQEQGPEEKAP